MTNFALVILYCENFSQETLNEKQRLILVVKNIEELRSGIGEADKVCLNYFSKFRILLLLHHNIQVY